MLAVVSQPTAGNNNRDGRDKPCETVLGSHDFPDDNLLESIDFDDLFVGMDDMLPDLEMDPELITGSTSEFTKSKTQDLTSTNEARDRLETNRGLKSKNSSQGKRKVKVIRVSFLLLLIIVAAVNSDIH